jgi:ankyrin repeat protein
VKNYYFFSCLIIFLSFSSALLSMQRAQNLKGKKRKYGHEYKESLIKSARNNDLKAVQFYISIGAEIDCEIYQKQTDSETPLLWALHNQNFAMANFLKRNGADVNQKLRWNKTLLHILAKNQHTSLDVIRWLLINGADINAIDEGKHSALLYACNANNADIAELLCAYGAHVNTADWTGQTPLNVNNYVAERKDQALKIAILLIAEGAHINVKCLAGITPLMRACMLGEDLVQYLLYEGANKNYCDKTQRTASNFYANLPEVRALLNSLKKPDIPESARTIMLEMASQKKNIATLLQKREYGKRLKR